VPRRRPEGAPRHDEPCSQPVRPCRPWIALIGIFAHYGALQHEVSRDEPGTSGQQPVQQVGRDRVRRAGHDAERVTGQPEAPRVGLDHRDLGESPADGKTGVAYETQEQAGRRAVFRWYATYR